MSQGLQTEVGDYESAFFFGGGGVAGPTVATFQVDRNVIARAVELVRETCAEERETSESVEQLFSGWSGGWAMGILMARSFVSCAR